MGCGKIETMGFWSKTFRCTAMFLVLFATVEILACDFLPDPDCYISHRQDQGQTQGSGDNCLCCCTHIVVVQPLIFEPRETIATAPPEESVQQPLFAPSHIDHPPQLS
jgi:hypothetical protein